MPRVSLTEKALAGTTGAAAVVMVVLIALLYLFSILVSIFIPTAIVAILLDAFNIWDVVDFV